MIRLLETMVAHAARLLERAPTAAIVCFGVCPAAVLAIVFVAIATGGEPARATQAAESAARAQWVQVYWQRRQARAFEAACDPALVCE